MGTGILSDSELALAVNEVKSVPGDFAEIGVFRGASLRRFAGHAAIQHRIVHGFDSFTGMNDPGEYDGTSYPKGKFDVGGLEGFLKNYFQDVPKASYRLWQGFVPDSFTQFPEDIRFSLIYVDLDHYYPTVLAIQWAWQRLNNGGILILNDFTSDTSQLASKAIDEFLTSLENSPGHADIRLNDNDLVMVRKKG